MPAVTGGHAPSLLATYAMRTHCVLRTENTAVSSFFVFFKLYDTRYFLEMHNFALFEKMRRFYVTDIDTATRYPYLLRVATKDPSSVRLHRLKKKVSHSAKVGTKKKVHFFGMHNIALSI